MEFYKMEDLDMQCSQEVFSLPRKPHLKKLLPDRTKAAWDRANQKLVDFIVKTKGADVHLLHILQGKKSSRWLVSFLKAGQSMICTETYLEDEDQLYIIGKHLLELFKHAGKNMSTLPSFDAVKFVVEVLLPEAMIYSIAAVEGLDSQKAEEKYLQGPPVHPRDKELFDQTILKERKKRCVSNRQRVGDIARPFY